MKISDQDRISKINSSCLIPEIYSFLWMKEYEDLKGKKMQNNVVKLLNVPDTVIFEYSKPIDWYFSKKGRIRRKSKLKLTNEKILEVFNKNIGKSGIVGYFIHHFQEHAKNSLSYEFFNKNSLKQFLYNDDIKKFGILQKFVEPYEKFNSVIEVKWSHYICRLEKITNRSPINDKKFSMYERASPISTEFSFVKTSSVTAQQVNVTIEKLMESISRVFLFFLIILENRKTSQ